MVLERLYRREIDWVAIIAMISSPLRMYGRSILVPAFTHISFLEVSDRSHTGPNVYRYKTGPCFHRSFHCRRAPRLFVTTS
jgi:hypothetical protein